MIAAAFGQWFILPLRSFINWKGFVNMIQETYCKSSDHVTDDVTWPQKVKIVTPKFLQLNTNSHASYGDGFNRPSVAKTYYAKRSCDWWHHMKHL